MYHKRLWLMFLLGLVLLSMTAGFIAQAGPPALAKLIMMPDNSNLVLHFPADWHVTDDGETLTFSNRMPPGVLAGQPLPGEISGRVYPPAYMRAISSGRDDDETALNMLLDAAVLPHIDEFTPEPVPGLLNTLQHTHQVYTGETIYNVTAMLVRRGQRQIGIVYTTTPDDHADFAPVMRAVTAQIEDVYDTLDSCYEYRTSNGGRLLLSLPADWAYLRDGSGLLFFAGDEAALVDFQNAVNPSAGHFAGVVATIDRDQVMALTDETDTSLMHVMESLFAPDGLLFEQNIIRETVEGFGRHDRSGILARGNATVTGSNLSMLDAVIETQNVYIVVVLFGTSDEINRYHDTLWMIGQTVQYIPPLPLDDGMAAVPLVAPFSDDNGLSLSLPDGWQAMSPAPGRLRVVDGDIVPVEENMRRVIEEQLLYIDVVVVEPYILAMAGMLADDTPSMLLARLIDTLNIIPAIPRGYVHAFPRVNASGGLRNRLTVTELPAQSDVHDFEVERVTLLDGRSAYVVARLMVDYHGTSDDFCLGFILLAWDDNYVMLTAFAQPFQFYEALPEILAVASSVEIAAPDAPSPDASSPDG